MDGRAAEDARRGGRAGARRHRGGHRSTGRSIWWRALAALVVALALQVGVNYANDYSDGVRGTDAEPPRSGAAHRDRPRDAGRGAQRRDHLVRGRRGRRRGAVARRQPVAAARRRGRDRSPRSPTPAGPKPYGYIGLGEVMVLVFFGFVATVGSAYVQHRPVPGVAWSRALAVGLAGVRDPARATTCATSRPIASPASARSRCASARAGPACSTSRASSARCVAVVACGVLVAVRVDRARSRRRSRSRRADRAHTARSARRSSPRSSAPSASSSCSRCCSRSGCGWASRAAAANAAMKPPSTAGLFERQRVAAVEPHVHDVGAHAFEHLLGDRGRTSRRCVPVTSATGICELAQLDPTSVPSRPRRARAGSARGTRRVSARRSARPGASAGTVANIGCASHASRNASTPSRSIDARELLVRRDRARRALRGSRDARATR